MDVRLFVLGTSHPIQCGSRGSTPQQCEAFSAELRRICVAEAIKRISEEMSNAALEHQGVPSTLGARIAAELSIEHQMVDLEPVQRKELSLDDGAMLNIVMNRRFADGGGTFRNAFDHLWNDVRERAWIGRMLAGKTWPMLFVCGSDHAGAVEALWQSLGLPVTVVHQNFEPD